MRNGELSRIRICGVYANGMSLLQMGVQATVGLGYVRVCDDGQMCEHFVGMNMRLKGGWGG